MLPTALIAHQMDRRVRIHVPSKQRDASYFSMLKEELSRCPGVDTVEVRPLTGGVLVLHHAALSAVAQYAAEHGLFSVAQNEEDQGPVSNRISTGFSDLSLRISRFSKGKVDLPSAAFFLLAGAGVVQILRRNVMPAAVTLLWYAAAVLPKTRMASGGRAKNDVM